MTAITMPRQADQGTTRRPGVLAQLGVDTAYVLLGFPLGIIAFTLVVTGLSLGIGLIPLMLIGIPVLLVILLLARGFAEVERSRLALVLRRDRATVPYRRVGPDAGMARRIFTPLGEPQYWLDALHALVRMPVNTVAFSIVVTWWATALSGLSYALWSWALPADQGDVQTLPEWLGFQDTPGTRIVFYLVVGVVFAATLAPVVRACALLEAWSAHALLNGVADLRESASGYPAPGGGPHDPARPLAGAGVGPGAPEAGRQDGLADRTDSTSRT